MSILEWEILYTFSQSYNTLYRQFYSQFCWFAGGPKRSTRLIRDRLFFEGVDFIPQPARAKIKQFSIVNGLV